MDEMVGRRGGSAEVEDSEMGVGGYGGEDGGGVWGECSAVGAGMGWEG